MVVSIEKIDAKSNFSVDKCLARERDGSLTLSCWYKLGYSEERTLEDVRGLRRSDKFGETNSHELCIFNNTLFFNKSDLKFLKFIAMSSLFANYRPKLEAISADPRMNEKQYTL